MSVGPARTSVIINTDDESTEVDPVDTFGDFNLGNLPQIDVTDRQSSDPTSNHRIVCMKGDSTIVDQAFRNDKTLSPANVYATLHQKDTSMHGYREHVTSKCAHAVNLPEAAYEYFRANITMKVSDIPDPDTAQEYKIREGTRFGAGTCAVYVWFTNNIDTNQEHVVEEILDHDMRGGKVYLTVYWASAETTEGEDRDEHAVGGTPNEALQLYETILASKCSAARNMKPYTLRQQHRDDIAIWERYEKAVGAQQTHTHTCLARRACLFFCLLRFMNKNSLNPKSMLCLVWLKRASGISAGERTGSGRGCAAAVS